MPERRAHRHAAHAPWTYVLATLAWSWTLWGVLAVTGLDWRRGVGAVLYALGGLGPVLAASTLVALGRADERLGEFWRRCLDPRRMAPQWWLVVLAIAVLPALAARAATRGDDGLLVAAPTAFLLVGALAGWAASWPAPSSTAGSTKRRRPRP